MYAELDHLPSVGLGADNNNIISRATKPRFSTEEFPRDTYGQDTIDLWKHTAGRSKPWRQLPLSTRPKRANQKTQHQRTSKPQITTPAVQRPANFECHEKCRVPIRRPKARQSLHEELLSHEDEPEMLHCLHAQSVFASVDAEGGASPYDVEPERPFILSVWEATSLAHGIKDTERFLPLNLTFKRGWSLVRFLRDESHADVYSASRTMGCPGHMLGTQLEAHVFLHEDHGRPQHYAKRHKNRLRKTGNCLDTFWHDDRRVFIMSVPQAPDTFRLQNNESEFPCLVDQKVWAEKAAKRQREVRRQPTYAAVLRKSPVDALLGEHAQKVDTVYAKEMAQINFVTVKKRQKQRSKRQAQRESKRLHVENHGW